MTDEDRSPVMFSRSTMGGKKTSKVEVRVSDELKDLLSRKWREAGYSSESEYVERLISIAVYGPEAVEAKQRSMMDAILHSFRKK